MQLKLMIQMEPPALVQSQAQQPAQRSIEEEIRHALDCIESGHDSGVEWLMVCKIYKQLLSLEKPSPKAKNILDLITPIMSKYGYHQEISPEQRDGATK